MRDFLIRRAQDVAFIVLSWSAMSLLASLLLQVGGA
jgi:hypothetical protein